MFYEPRRPALLCANVSIVRLCIIKDWEYIEASLNIYSFNCWFSIRTSGRDSMAIHRFTLAPQSLRVIRTDASRSVRKRTSCGVSYSVSSAGTAVTQTGSYWFEFLFFKVWPVSDPPAYVSSLRGSAAALHSRVTLLGSGGTSRPEPVLEEKGNPLLLLLPLLLSLLSSLCFANHDSYSLPLTDCERLLLRKNDISPPSLHLPRHKYCLLFVSFYY